MRTSRLMMKDSRHQPRQLSKMLSYTSSRLPVLDRNTSGHAPETRVGDS